MTTKWPEKDQGPFLEESYEETDFPCNNRVNNFNFVKL
jgi:hypothetical protein